MGENSKTPIPRSQKSDLFKSYLKGLKEPPTRLDDFDCGNEDIISEYYNFDPERILELLVERAASTNLSPETFYKEMKQLIFSRNRANILLTSSEKITNEAWYKSLLRLESIYSVRLSGTSPDSITFSRLCFIFPHYSVILNEKPSCISSYSDIFASSLFYPPEFAALIPFGRILKETVREALIIIHIFILHSENKSIPLRTLQILVKRRIQWGLLSDERRVRFLENKDVITHQGELSSTSKASFDYLKNHCDEFMSKIQRHLIN